MRLVEISMRVFTWEAFRWCRFDRGNQRMRKRVPLHRAASTETSDCFSLRYAVSRLFTGMKFSLENRGELGSGGIIPTIREPQEGTEQDSAREDSRPAVS